MFARQSNSAAQVRSGVLSPPRLCFAAAAVPPPASHVSRPCMRCPGRPSRRVRGAVASRRAAAGLAEYGAPCMTVWAAPRLFLRRREKREQPSPKARAPRHSARYGRPPKGPGANDAPSTGGRPCLQGACCHAKGLSPRAGGRAPGCSATVRVRYVHCGATQAIVLGDGRRRRRPRTTCQELRRGRPGGGCCSTRQPASPSNEREAGQPRR